MAACEEPNMETPPGGNTRKRRSWFTPGKAPIAYQLAVQPPSPEAPKIDTTDLEILTLTHFTRPPKVDFGTVRPGDCVTRHLRVINPHEYPQELRVEKAGRDFCLSDPELVVEAEGEVILSVEWIPLTVGAYRETVLFKVDGAYKLQATFMGKLEEPPKPKKKARKTWAAKPFVPVRGVLRNSNKCNTNTQQTPPRVKLLKTRSPPGKQPKSRSPQNKQPKSRSPQNKQSKSRSPPSKPAAKRGMRQATTKLKTPPPKRISDPEPKLPDPAPYLNPQVPINPVSFMFEKRTMPQGPLDSPVDPRRTTFEKSSPEMSNTPVISERTPPLSMREKVIHPRRILAQKTPSPLAAVRESKEDLENLPPIPFCDDATPGPRNKRTKSKMRRSNTYTKLNDSSIQSPADSEADTTVIEKTEITDYVEVTEYTEVHEEIVEVEEQVEYLVEEDGTGGETRTEVSRAIRPVGRQVFSQQSEANMTYQAHHTHTTYHQEAFDATRVLMRCSDASLINSSRLSMAAPHHATFVKTPHGAPPNLLSETRVLTPQISSINNTTHAARPDLSETRVITPQIGSVNNAMMHGTRPNLSDTQVLGRISSIGNNTMRESLPISQHHELSQARVHTPTPASPRRFFSDLLALHEGNSSKEDSETFEKTPPQNSFPQPLPSPDQRRVSSLTVTKERPDISREEFVPQRALFENDECSVNPRRFSTLTVTKNRPSECFPPVVNQVDPRRASSLTVTKEHSTVPSPHSAGIEGRCLFQSDSPRRSRQSPSTPDSPGVAPLIDSPSPRCRQTASPPSLPAVMSHARSPSPCRQTPNKIDIYGTNYPGSRSPRKLDEDESLSQSVSPRKKTARERTRRRTSGQFRRRSATYQAGNGSLNGSLVARGLVQGDKDSDDQADDSPLSMSDLGTSTDYRPQPLAPITQHAKPATAQRPNMTHLKPEICGPLRASGPTRQPRPLTKPPPPKAQVAPARVKTAAPAGTKKAPVVANYLRPTSAVQNRRQAVADSKKRELSTDRRKVPVKAGTAATMKAPQEPASKRVRREVTTAPQSVVGGLTKAQALRREAALAGMNKEKKKPVAPRPKPKVAQQTLRLLAGSNKTALPKHPMAFAAKNKYYDERWKEKQERGFVRWLNFVLTPPEEESSVADKKQKVDAGALSLSTVSGPQPAPTKETLSFRVYSARRRLNRLRRGACKLYTSEAFTRFEQKLEVEAECGRIMVRTDRMIHADVGIKQCILDLLLSYNPLWLRIGLETVYGEMLPITSNSDVVGMSRFILTRLLSNPYIAEEYAHPSVPHLYRDGYDKRIAQFSLKQFLLLVTFLDLAKTSRLIDHDPCLFCRNSEHKASRDMLLVFSRDYLSGEGDLCKHLTYMGYTVKHVQTPLDELDYAVNNLAVDLRDGTRLTRVMAMLTQRWTLTSELRVPAISRLQKIHNIGVAFKTLDNMGLDLTTIKGGKIDSRDICDGHREKTLTLLWQIIFKFQVETLLSEEQLRDEIHFLRTNLSIQTRLDAALNDDIETLGIPEERRESIDTDLYFKSPRLSLLLTWCRAVCSYYGVKVENFTVSFSDGRALCLLVHHYHPGLLTREEINNETTQTMGPGAHNMSIDSEGDDSFNETWYTSFSPSTGKPDFWDSLLANERENFRLLYDRVNELGNIPVMVRSGDMSNTIPDEKVVITYVSYLCARLLDIRHETRAARVIQVWWRRHQLHRHKEALTVRQEAAVKIQHVVRSFLSRRRHERQLAAAVVIQTAVRGYLGRREAAQRRLEREMANKTTAVLTIQAYTRTWLVCRRIKRQAEAAVRIQAWWRMTRSRNHFHHHLSAALTIQHWYKAHRAMQHERQQYLTLKSAAVCIQAHIRSWLVRRELLQNHLAAVRIQSWWRMIQCERRFLIQREAAMIIQRQYRACIQGRQQRKKYLEMKSAVMVLERAFMARKLRILQEQRAAAVTIQKQWRCLMAVRRHKAVCQAAVCIQTWYRARQQRQCFCQMKQAAVCIQAYTRSWIIRQHQKHQSSAAVVIQSWWRMIQGRKAFLRQKQSVVTIQKAYRALKLSQRERKQYLEMKSAVVTLQRAFRGRKARIAFKQHLAAITIQKYWRALMARAQYRRLRSATITIQSCFRAAKQRKECIRIQRAALCIQAHVRSWRVRTVLRHQSQTAVMMQSWWRMVKVQRIYVIQKAAAITLQEHYRAYMAGKSQRAEFNRQKLAATSIQAQWRCRVTAQRYKHTRAAVALIQRWYRARCERVLYCRQKEAAVYIQSYMRGWTLRRTLRQQAAATLRIQSWWRMVQARQVYNTKRCAAITIQTRLRATLAARKQQENYATIKSATITLQRAFVAWKAKIVLKQNQAATMIQTHWRTHLAVKHYNRTKAAVVVLQRWVRAKQQRCRYLELQQAAVRIQAHVRCWLVQCRLEKQNAAAVIAQAWWRMVCAQKSYCQQRQAVIVIQVHFRAYRLGKLQQAQYEAVQNAVLTIQKTWRSHCVRARYQRQREAAIMLQTWHRAWRQRQTYCRVKQATMCIQSHVRAWLIGRRERTQYLAVRKAVITLQAAVRGHQQRAQYVAQKQAAVKVQALWRGYSQKIQFMRFKTAACVIQTRYRARLLTRKVKTEYVTKKRSVVTLQAAWRGYTERRNYLHMKQATVIIQSNWRQHHQQKQFQAKKTAAVYIQRWYWAEKLRQRDQREFYVKLGAVITLQAAARGWQVRRWARVLRRLQHAAITIQSHVRRYQAQKSYTQQRQAALTIQRRYRAWVVGSRQYCHYHITRGASLIIQAQVRGWLKRCEYRKLQTATITIQSYYRGWAARRQYQQVKTEHAAATRIQAHYRRHRQQRQLLRLRAAVVITQHYYRARLAMRYHRYHFILKKKAAVTIQTAVRGHLAKRDVQRRQDQRVLETKTTAATCIQSYFRRYRQQRQLLRLKAAIVVTQHYYRAKLDMRRQRSQYLQTKRAAVTIQTAFRGYQARQELRRRQEAKELERRHSAATCIQAYYRRYKQQQRLLRLKAAVVITQHYYRARLSMRHHRYQYVQKKKAAVTIQTAIRRFLARKELKKRQEEKIVFIKTTAATCIQSHFRRYRQQRQILRLKAAVVITQHYYRAKLAMRRQRCVFLQMKTAAVIIQTAFRGYQARQELSRLQEAKELERRHSAATHIQAYYRRHREQQRLLRLKAAVVITQYYYRARLSMRHHRYQYVQKKKAAITIQTAIRRFLARKELKKRQEEKIVFIKTTAATCIQSHFRRYRQQRQVLRLKAAVVVTQHYYRAKLAMRRQRCVFLQQKQAAITIQTALRQFLARRELKRRQEERLVQIRNVAATHIQAYFRRYLQQRQLLRLKAAVVITQYYYRARLAMKYHRYHFLLKRKAAVKIQAALRGCLVRRELKRKHEASVSIQAAYRCYVLRHEFVKQRTAVKAIQSVYRAHVLRKQAVRHFKVCRGSAITIQSAYRGYITRKQLASRQRSATLVQAAFRGYRARTQFIRIKSAVQVLQIHYRSRRLMKQERHQYVVQRAAATKLQSAVRGFMVRRELRKRKEAVTVIQSVYRRYRCQKTYITMRTEYRRRTQAVTVIQRCLRRYHHRKVVRIAAERRAVYLEKVTSVTRRYISVVRIQRTFRKYRALKEAKRQIKSVIILQHWMRGRLDRLRYLRLRQMVINIQRMARVYLSRRETSVIKIQTYVRNWLARRRMARVLRGVRRIQALWRGYRVRRDVKSSKVRAARRRVEAANANVTAEKKLGHMTCGALDFLLRCKQLSTIMEALMMLEPATRWSSVCCEQMAQSNAAGVLFALIRSCNRSVPHMDIITYSIDILLNLTKYDKTSSSVYEAEGSISTLIRLLTIYRDKGVIFNKACTLLGLLAYPEHRRLEVLAVPQLIQQVRSVHALTLRKYKMEEERNLIKTKMAAANSLSGCSFLVSMPNRPNLPRIEPAWLLRRQSVRQMETPLQAAKFVMTALQITPKK